MSKICNKKKAIEESHSHDRERRTNNKHKQEPQRTDGNSGRKENINDDDKVNQNIYSN